MRLEASARSMALLCACGVLLEILAGPARAAGFDINTFANAFTPAGGNAITLAKPTGVAADADGNVYVADSGNCVVWEFPSGGAPPTVVAGQLGNCAGSPSSSNPATDTLDHPVDVAVCNKVIFIADTVSSGTSALHKVAGGIFSNIPFSAAPVLKANGNLQPQAITCDQTGDIFVESIYFAQDGDAYQYSLDTVSASGISSNIYAEFDTEYQGVAVDALGNAYTVRGNPAAAVIAKFIPTGSGTKVVWQEQTLTQSRSLVGATRLALDSAGNFYVPEAPPGASPLSTPSAPVYVTQLSPGVGGGYGVTYIAGNGTAGYSGDGGPALLAELNDDNGIGIATAGTALYVADTNNDRIRELYQLATGPSALVANDRIPNFSLDTAVNPQTDRLYVAVSRGNYTEGGPFEDIVVYNTVDDTVVANIPTTSAAPVSFLTIDTVNDFVYASNQDGTVAVIDGATNTLDALLTVGSNPTGIAVDPGLNTAYVANSTDSFISVIHGPVRTSGVITAPAYTLSSENISGVIPLGPIGVYPGTHTVYAVTAGPANPGSETYTLTTINGATYTVTSNLAYLSNAGSTSVAPNALAVDGANGLVVIADAEDQAAHVYNPVTAGLQSYSESFYPAAVAIDSTSGFAYVSSGYGNVSEVNLQTGAQSTVYPPAGSAPVTSCGSGGTAVGVDPSSGQAYFTTCDTANLSRLLLWNGVGLSLTATIGLPGALTGNESFAVALDPTTHVAYVSNGANSSEIDAINGPGAPQSPQLSLSVNGAANQALDAAQTIAFGDVANGTTSAASSLEITNSGTTTAAIGAPLLLGTGFAITTDSCALGSLAPTAVCDTGVAFKPTAATSYHGGLAYLDSERDTPQLVGLSGTGTGSSALIITPTSLPAGYVDESYPLSGVPIQFDISGGSFPVTANLCQTLASGKAGTLCCPVSESTLGPSCPAGLLPNGLSLAYNSLSGTPAAGSAGTYLLTLTASDASGDKPVRTIRW